MGLQTLPLFSWNSIPILLVKNPEMGYILFVPTPSFKRSDSIKLLVRHPILDIGWTVYCFIPKIWWQIFKLHHTSFHLLECSILPLRNTILLRCVGNRWLHLDSCIFMIMDEMSLDILTTNIYSEDLEFPPRLVLNQGFKILEEVKNFRLDFKEVNPIVSGKFIYKG